MNDKDNKKNINVKDNINDGENNKYKSYFRDYTGEHDFDNSGNNVHIINGNGNVPYGRFVVEQKVFKYCWKCGKELPEGSLEPFCSWDCKQEYYREIAQEIDAVWGEITGKD